MKKQFFYLNLLLLFTILFGCDKNEPDPVSGGGGGNTTTLTITSVNPTSGAEGAKVVITGTGFSTTLSNNVVKFGTVAATVDSASTTRIITKVPKDAKTGRVSVEVGGKTATSASDFIVSAIKQPELGPASTNTSSGISSSGAGVASSVTAKGEKAISQHGHVWSKTNNPPTLSDSKSELGALADTVKYPYKFSSELKSLEANTLYYVRGYVTVEGVTTYGEVFQIKTIQDDKTVPSLSILKPEVVDIQRTSFLLKGKLIDRHGMNIKEYGFCVSTTNEQPTIADKKQGKTGALNNGSKFEEGIINLTENTSYYARAFATTTDGKTGYSEVLSVKTYDNSPPTITAGQVMRVGENVIKIAGSSFTATGNNPVIGYGYFYTTNRNDFTSFTGLREIMNKNTEEAVSKTFDGEINKLLPNTTYFIRAFAYHRGTTQNPLLSTELIVKTSATASDFVLVSVNNTTSGKSGDIDGPLDQASFGFNGGVAVGNDGSIYVSNLFGGKHTIRKIANGQVSTIAGSTKGNKDGVGAAAQFNWPTGIFVTPENNLVIVDQELDGVRTYTASTGQVGTLDVGGLKDINDVTQVAGFTGTLLAAKNQVILSSSSGNNAIFSAGTSDVVYSITGNQNGELYALYGITANSKLVKIDKNGTAQKYEKGHFGLDTYVYNVRSIKATADGKYLYFIYDERSKGYLGRMEIASGKIEHLILPVPMREFAIDPKDNTTLYAFELLSNSWRERLYKIKLK